jgi:hypothetical protein
MKTKAVLLSTVVSAPELCFYLVEFDNKCVAYVGTKEQGISVNFKGSNVLLNGLTQTGIVSATVIEYPLKTFHIHNKDKEVTSEVCEFPTGYVVEHYLPNNSFMIFNSIDVLKEYLGDRYTLEALS